MKSKPIWTVFSYLFCFGRGFLDHFSWNPGVTQFQWRQNVTYNCPRKVWFTFFLGGGGNSIIFYFLKPPSLGRVVPIWLAQFFFRWGGEKPPTSFPIFEPLNAEFQPVHQSKLHCIGAGLLDLLNMCPKPPSTSPSKGSSVRKILPKMAGK